MIGCFTNMIEYKNHIKDLFYSNQNLLKYLSHTSETPLEEEDIEDVVGVVNKNIFFKAKDISTISKATSLLFVKFNVDNIHGSTAYKKIRMYVDIFVTFDINELEDGSERWMRIAEEVDKMLNGSRSRWLGKIQLEREFEITNTTTMAGRRLVYNFVDFGFNYRNRYED